MKIRLLDTGYCKSFEHVAIQGGAYRSIRFPSMAAVIEHPTEGFILFDTGYSPRIYDVCQQFPNRFYLWMLPPTTSTQQSVKFQLAQMGIAPEEIRYVIVSHFHADHCCGLKDFPKATYICSQSAYQHLQSLDTPIKAAKEAVFWELLPDDLANRLWLFDTDAAIATHQDPILGTQYDLFGDGTLLLVPLPGHQTGQIGAIVQTAPSPYFLVADACWLRASYEQNKMPSVLTKFLFSDFEAYRQTLSKLHHYSKENPQTAIIPTHCQPTIQHHVAKTSNTTFSSSL